MKFLKCSGESQQLLHFEYSDLNFGCLNFGYRGLHIQHKCEKQEVYTGLVGRHLEKCTPIRPSKRQKDIIKMDLRNSLWRCDLGWTHSGMDPVVGLGTGGVKCSGPITWVVHVWNHLILKVDSVVINIIMNTNRSNSSCVLVIVRCIQEKCDGYCYSSESIWCCKQREASYSAMDLKPYKVQACHHASSKE
jgi:hypothetical protein